MYFEIVNTVLYDIIYISCYLYRSYPCSRANCFARSVETCLLSSKSALFPQRTCLDFSFEITKNNAKIRFTNRGSRISQPTARKNEKTLPMSGVEQYA